MTWGQAKYPVPDRPFGRPGGHAGMRVCARAHPLEDQTGNVSRRHGLGGGARASQDPALHLPWQQQAVALASRRPAVGSLGEWSLRHEPRSGRCGGQRTRTT